MSSRVLKVGEEGRQLIQQKSRRGHRSRGRNYTAVGREQKNVGGLWKLATARERVTGKAAVLTRAFRPVDPVSDLQPPEL